MTTVSNLLTGAEINYSLPPIEAVKVAYLQYTKGDWNTWTYDAYDWKDTPVCVGELTVRVGDWAAWLKERA